MPAPTTALNGRRPDIGTMIQFDLEADRLGFIATLVAPVFETPVQNGTYGRIKFEELMKEPEIGRNSRGEYNRTNFGFDDQSFATKEYGLEIPVDERQSRIYQEFFDYEVVAARNCLGIVMRAAEKRWADQLFNETTFSGQTTAAGTAWDDLSNCAPVTNIDAAKTAVWDRTGIWPNTLVITRKTFMNLRKCDEVTDKLHSEGAGQSIEPGRITPMNLASVFDVDRVVVAGGARNSANEGQSRSVASIWSDSYALLARTATSNMIDEACLARTFHWNDDGSTIGGTVETYYDDRSRGDIVRVRHEVDEKMIYTELGQLITGIKT
jgi:hypothetical protein